MYIAAKLSNLYRVKKCYSLQQLSVSSKFESKKGTVSTYIPPLPGCTTLPLFPGYQHHSSPEICTTKNNTVMQLF